MLPISENYLEAIVAGRRRIKGKVEIIWSDPTIDTDVTTSASEYNFYGRVAQITNNAVAPTEKWFSLDSTTRLDGSYKILPVGDLEYEQREVGWWSRQVSDEYGNFQNPPILTVFFNPRPIVALKVVGDILRNEFPVNFKIKIFEGVDVIFEREITNNASISWQEDIVESEILNATRLTLEIMTWNKQFHTAKIMEFFSAVKSFYEGDDLLLIDLTEESELSNGSLPIGNISSNELKVRINNITNLYHPGNYKSPMYGLIRKNRRVRAWIGIEHTPTLVEWHSLGVFWSGDWIVDEDNTYAESICYDLLHKMQDTKINTNEIMTNVSMYELAQYVLEDFGLVSTEYDIDPYLQGIVIPYGWFIGISHREALRKIAEASLSRVYIDREGIVKIKHIEY